MVAARASSPAIIANTAGSRHRPGLPQKGTQQRKTLPNVGAGRTPTALSAGSLPKPVQEWIGRHTSPRPDLETTLLPHEKLAAAALSPQKGAASFATMAKGGNARSPHKDASPLTSKSPVKRRDAKRSPSSTARAMPALEVKRLQRPSSAPSLRPSSKQQERSTLQPGAAYMQAQTLVEVDLQKRRWTKQLVTHTGVRGSMLSRPLPFATAERGLIYDILGKAAVAPDKLPPFEDVVRAACLEFGIPWPPPKREKFVKLKREYGFPKVIDPWGEMQPDWASDQELMQLLGLVKKPNENELSVASRSRASNIEQSHMLTPMEEHLHIDPEMLHSQDERPDSPILPTHPAFLRSITRINTAEKDDNYEESNSSEDSNDSTTDNRERDEALMWCESVLKKKRAQSLVVQPALAASTHKEEDRRVNFADDRVSTVHRPNDSDEDDDLPLDRSMFRRKAVARPAVVTALLHRCETKLRRNSPLSAVLETFAEAGRITPWDDRRLHEVFLKFKTPDSSEMQVEDLEKAMVELGIENKDENSGEEFRMRILDIVAKEITTFQAVDMNDFLTFLRKYREWELLELWSLFCKADTDDSGAIELEELHVLLHSLGYRISRMNLSDVNAAFDTDGDGVIEIMEFEQLLHFIRTTAGFVTEELDFYRELFVRVAGSEDEAVTVEKIWRMLSYTGFPAKLETVISLAQELQANHSTPGIAPMFFRDVLKIIRAYRDLEHSQFIEILLEHEYMGSELIAEKDVALALGDLGYFVSDEFVEEAMEEYAFERDQPDALGLHQIEHVAKTYRSTGGFTKAKLASIREAFTKADKDSTGVLNALGIGQVLRWVGFSVKLVQQLHLLRAVDLDGDHLLDFNELVTLVRRMHSEECDKRRRVFKTLTGGARLPLSKFGHTYAQVTGVMPCKSTLGIAIKTVLEKASKVSPSLTRKDRSKSEHVHQTWHKDSEEVGWPAFIDTGEFERMCDCYFELDAVVGRAHAGYTAKEIDKLRKLFEEFDEDGSGTIDGAEVRKTLARLFPEGKGKKWRTSTERAEWLTKLLAEIDANGDNEVEFAEFIWLMRAADDVRDEADMNEEFAVVEEFGVTESELEGFREVFLSKASAKGDLTLNETIEMLEFVDLTRERSYRLLELVRETTQLGQPGHDAIRFPEFLRFFLKALNDDGLGLGKASMRMKEKAVTEKRWADMVREDAASVVRPGRRRAIIEKHDALGAAAPMLALKKKDTTMPRQVDAPSSGSAQSSARATTAKGHFEKASLERNNSAWF